MLPESPEIDETPTSGGPHRGLRAPQFRLSTLLLVVAILCGLLALTKIVSPLFSAVACLLILSIFAHVAGNAIGIRLRENGDVDLKGQDLEEVSHEIAEPTFAPPSSLRNHTRLGLSTIVPTAIFAVAGVAAGIWFPIQFSKNHTVANVAFGAISAGVLGGLLGFWISSLANIVLEAVVQAHRES